MKKIKKLKGGHELFVTEDEKLLVTSNSRNAVYVYDLETGELKFQTRTVSNVLKKAISPDKRLLAAKNTSGQMAIISMETGEEISRNDMECRKGEQMTFTSDSKSVLDFDWDGRTMLLNCENNQHKILDGIEQRNSHALPRVAHMQYDRYSNQIYKFVADNFGNSKGVIMSSMADKENISYEIIQEYPIVLPDHLWGLSFCRKQNYYIDLINNEIVVTNKQFTELSRIPFPSQVREAMHSPDTIWVSPCEHYVFFDMGRQYDPNNFHGTFSTSVPLSFLFKLDTMELIREFDYNYVSDFTMIDEDRKFILATWDGTYIGEI